VALVLVVEAAMPVVVCVGMGISEVEGMGVSAGVGVVVESEVGMRMVVISKALSMSATPTLPLVLLTRELRLLPIAFAPSHLPLSVRMHRTSSAVVTVDCCGDDRGTGSRSGSGADSGADSRSGRGAGSGTGSGDDSGSWSTTCQAHSDRKDTAGAVDNSSGAGEGTDAGDAAVAGTDTNSCT
jgi:hypothetical protein